MKQLFASLLLSCFLLSAISLSAQQEPAMDKTQKRITIKGSIIETESNKPISKVNIQVNGGEYTTSNLSGDFRIKAKVGDEMIITHKDFETIYYTVRDDDKLTIKVEPNAASEDYVVKRKQSSTFKSLIDSAQTYKKKSAERSIEFIEDALSETSSGKENGEAYETLGDIYMHWKQYDLAVSNYRISQQSYKTNTIQLKLAKAYEANKNYQESITLYKRLESSDLSNYQQVELYEGLGDVYAKTKDYNASTKTYKKGLEIAKKHLITPKITDLTSKLGAIYNASGATEKAEDFYNSSLDLASKENKKRAVIEKIKVADFQNSNQLYPKEIQLRKEAVKEIEDIETDSIIDNESTFTSQKQNYKIGNAYYLQRDYNEAIPYLEKSITEAKKREDLVVEKDAKRKLSEVYTASGDSDKALEVFKDYVATVDELYIKKEQEISQAARFSRDIANKQNRITSLEKDRQLNISTFQLAQEKNKRQQLIIYSLIGGVLLLILTAYLMYKSIKQQKLANNLLALKSLRSQMNPHFIFNALNSVNSFIATNDERTANKYLSDFSKLMRSVLENSEQDFIPLEKEVELLELYTKLEHFRFQDKFDYSITVDEAIAVNDFKIPPMLLQPYIENAVWHGLRYKEEKGQLDIAITQKNKDEIAITITDNGIGREKSKALKTENQQKQNSKGMGNIKKRVAILNEMYKDKVDVFIDDYQLEGDKGTKVVVTLKKD
ncbi:histidine kinase [Lacinutrix salivirga]